MPPNRPFATLAVLFCAVPLTAWSAAVMLGPDPETLASQAEHERSPQPFGASEPGAVPGNALADLCHGLAARLPQRLDQPCQTVVRPPFVLAGDLSEAELLAEFVETVQPGCEAMLASYFRQLPGRPVTILMFATEAAYRRAAEQLFFDRRVSRFGYYKPGRRTALVNLAEGDGGLLHELTHVLMDADFPGAPLWLQEGLATLHECSGLGTCGAPADATASAGTPAAARAEQTRNLVPRHNWRLAVLRGATAENRLPSLKGLITESTFRGPGEALDFAYARYFCWFLHERGKLQPLYVKLRERSAADVTGAETLREVLDNQEWKSIDRDFRIWLAAAVSHPS